MSFANELVTVLYREILGREPDQQGLRNHVAALSARHISIETLYRAFIESPERQQRSRKKSVYEDLIPIPYLGCDFLVSEGSILAAELRSPEGYEPWALPHFLQACQEGTTVVDVGASWGVYAFPAAKRVGPTGRVFGVEVSPRNCEVLLRIAELNDIDNFELLAVGVSDRVGVARLPVQKFTNTNSIDQIIRGRGMSHVLFSEFNVVPTLPLDLLQAHIGRVDVLKMDIDGTEYRACMGARRLLMQSRPIVFLEYSPQLLRLLSGVEPEALLKLFLDWGYGVDVLHRGRPREQIQGGPGDIIAKVRQICEDHVKQDGGTHLDLCMTPDRSSHNAPEIF
jgi:FkbM family methyltransferase